MKALWIRVEAHEVDSVRVAQLAEALGIDPVMALGHLVALAGQVAEQTPDGHIATVPNVTIERWARWSGRRGEFARAVREILQDGAGFLDDWNESMGKLVERRAKDRQRKAGSKESPGKDHGNSTENPRNGRGDSSATERDGTERTTPPNPPTAGGRGEALELLAKLDGLREAVTAPHGGSRHVLALERVRAELGDDVADAVKIVTPARILATKPENRGYIVAALADALHRVRSRQTRETRETRS